MPVNFKKHSKVILMLVFVFTASLVLAQSSAKEIISVKPNSWRAATVFTHVIWNDILFYGGGAGKDGGDPRHEMEIGAFHLITPDSGYHHNNNPIITRAQFNLDKPGKGITPLSIFDRGDSLFMFCTSRPDDDLQPHIVQIAASIENPYKWENYKTIVDEAFSGKVNNHGASVIVDPDNPDNILLYFAARSPEDNYRILLATVPIAEIAVPTSYKLLKSYHSPVLSRPNGKTNYPFVRYCSDTKEYELWYSGQTIDNPKTRSCFKTLSKQKDNFNAATKEIIKASGIPMRNDNAYATGPKVYQNNLYYSGRNKTNGNYLAIFYSSLAELRTN